jgi:hypothetical protein
MTSQEEDQVLPNQLGFSEDANKLGRFKLLSSRVQKDLLRSWMFGEKIKLLGRDFSHNAFGIATTPFQVFRSHCVCVSIARLANKVKKNLQKGLAFNYSIGRTGTLEVTVNPPVANRTREAILF